VLLLDEPTSAMDDRTEEEFRRRLAAILPGKTLVLVTHKLAALDLVDRLIVVDGGRVVVDGPKEQVLGALMGGELRRTEGGAP
jgi:ATP-binding cassette subfamily C protein LapB